MIKFTAVNDSLCLQQRAAGHTLFTGLHPPSPLNKPFFPMMTTWVCAAADPARWGPPAPDTDIQVQAAACALTSTCFLMDYSHLRRLLQLT